MRFALRVSKIVCGSMHCEKLETSGGGGGSFSTPEKIYRGCFMRRLKLPNLNGSWFYLVPPEGGGRSPIHAGYRFGGGLFLRIYRGKQLYFAGVSINDFTQYLG